MRVPDSRMGNRGIRPLWGLVYSTLAPNRAEIAAMVDDLAAVIGEEATKLLCLFSPLQGTDLRRGKWPDIGPKHARLIHLVWSMCCGRPLETVFDAMTWGRFTESAGPENAGGLRAAKKAMRRRTQMGKRRTV